MSRRAMVVVIGMFLSWGGVGVQGANQYKVSQVDGGMPYLLHLPAEYHTNPTKYYPTLIYLHGYGERCAAGSYGTTNELNKVENAGNTPPRHVRDGNAMGFMVNGVMEYFIVISPQVRAGRSWNAADIVALLDEVSSEVRVDPGRVYLTGFSFGGTGTWDVLREVENTPNRFAAAAPVHGWSRNQNLEVVAENKVAVWNFGGTSDGTVHTPERILSGSRNLRQYLPEAEVITTMSAGVGHSSQRPYTTNNAYHLENLYQWFLRQQLLEPGLPPANNLSNRPDTLATVGDQLGNQGGNSVKDTNTNTFWVSDTSNYENKWVMLDLGAVHSVGQIYLRFANSTSAAIKPTAPHGSITSIESSPIAGRVRIFSQGHGLQAKNSGQQIPGNFIRIQDSTGYNGGSFEVLGINNGAGWFEVNQAFSETSTGTWYALHETVAAYRVETSVNGTDWEILVEETGNYEFNKQHKFEAMPIRYARLSIQDPNRMTLPGFEHISKVSQFWILEAVDPVDPPEAPVGFTAGSVTSGGLGLEWQAPEGAVLGYRLYWSTGPTQPMLPNATVPAETTDYTLSGLEADTGYYFWVSAYNTGGESEAAAVAATTLELEPPAAPQGLSVSGISAGGMTLLWSDTADNEAGFHIYWSTENNRPETAAMSVGAEVGSAYAGGLAAETNYYFWVTAYNAAGESAAANVTATTLEPLGSIDVGVVSQWRFDEGTETVAVDSTGLAGGTLQGNAAWTAGGRSLSAVQLDGNNDYVEISHRAEYSGQALSISMWIRPDVVDAEPRGLISKRAGLTSSQRCFSIFSHTGSKLFLDIGTHRVDSGYVLAASATWRHLALVFDGTQGSDNLRLYIDGELVSLRTTTATAVPMISSPLTIGILNPDYGFGFQGGIDEVRIYSRVLTLEEVQFLAEEPVLIVDGGDPGPSFQEWVDTGVLEEVPLEQRGPLDDPDGDGIVNLLEFAFGLDPVSTSRWGVPQVRIVDEDGEQWLELVFRRREDAPGLEYIVEAGGDLVEWQTESEGIALIEELDAVDVGEGIEEVRVRHTLPMQAEESVFMRVRVMMMVE